MIPCNKKYLPLLRQDRVRSVDGLVTKVRVETRDPQFKNVGELQERLMKKRGDFFFFSWSVRRKYSRTEVVSAKLFQMELSAFFEPCGEECGTIYDDSVACQFCGASAVQVSDLRVDLRRVPRAKDIASTIANEWIISENLHAS